MSIKQNENTILFAKGLIEQSLKGKKQCGVMDRYNKSRKYRNGEHDIRKQPKSKGRKVFNKYAEIYENRVAHIVAKRPKWKYRPQGEDDLISADVANQVIGDVIWEMDEWEDKGEDSLYEAADAGSSHIKTNLKAGYSGLATFQVVPAPAIAPDPMATCKRNLRWIIHFIDMNVKDIERDYGVKVAPEIGLEELEEKGYESSQKSWQYVDGSDEMPNIWSGTNYGDILDTDKSLPDIIGKAKIAEIWLEDKKEEPIPFKPEEVAQEHQGFSEFKQQNVTEWENHPAHVLAHGEFLQTLDPVNDANLIKLISEHIAVHEQYNMDEKRPKYPYGRIITVCKDKLLDDKPANNPYTDEEIPIHWREMWIKWDYSKSGKYWGKPLGHDLFDIQDSLNSRKNKIERNIDLVNEGIKKLVVGSYNKLKETLKKFNNLIGKIVPVRHKDDLTTDYGAAFPSQIFQDLYHDEQLMDVISGNSDIIAGRMPSANAAGVTVDTLLGEGQKRINLSVKHYAFCLQQIARNASTIMKSVGDGEIVFRIIGNDGKYKQMNWEQLRKNLSVLDLRIDVESITTTSRQQKVVEAVQLYSEGVYDRQAVLERLDDPDKWNILQRVSEVLMLKQALAEAQDINNKAINEIDRLEQNVRAMNLKGDNAKKDKNDV